MPGAAKRIGPPVDECGSDRIRDVVDPVKRAELLLSLPDHRVACPIVVPPALGIEWVTIVRQNGGVAQRAPGIAAPAIAVGRQEQRRAVLRQPISAV